MRRYTVPCRTCNGKLLDGGTDNEGYPTLVSCARCYRGSLTIQLTPADEASLLAQLTKNGVK